MQHVGMHLVYLDESGNSGNNLADPSQPIFVLCALVVPEDCWQQLELDLARVIEKYWPGPRDDAFEIHTSELLNPKTKAFRISPDARFAFMKEWLGLAASRKLKVLYRAINKQRYQKWLLQRYGSGVAINPHVVAFLLLAKAVDNHLQRLPGGPLGIFIFDENRHVAHDVDKSIRSLRLADGNVRLARIIEKGFFIESHKSLVLQLCDMCAYFVRQTEHKGANLPYKTVCDPLMEMTSTLVVEIDEQFDDMMAWLDSDRKVERPGA
jgi:hypothetical protein